MDNFKSMKSDVDRLHEQAEDNSGSDDESRSACDVEQTALSQSNTTLGLFKNIVATFALEETKGSSVSQDLAQLFNASMDDKKVRFGSQVPSTKEHRWAKYPESEPRDLASYTE